MLWEILTEIGKLDFAMLNGISSSTVSVFRNTRTVGNIFFCPEDIDYATGNAPLRSPIAMGNTNGALPVA